MKDRYIPAIVMLIAGAAVSILNLVQKLGVLAGLKRLLIVLLIFYVIGLIAKSIIVKAINHKPEEKQDSEVVQESDDSQKETTEE